MSTTKHQAIPISEIVPTISDCSSTKWARLLKISFTSSICPCSTLISRSLSSMISFCASCSKLQWAEKNENSSIHTASVAVVACYWPAVFLTQLRHRRDSKTFQRNTSLVLIRRALLQSWKKHVDRENRLTCSANTVKVTSTGPNPDQKLLIKILNLLLFDQKWISCCLYWLWLQSLTLPLQFAYATVCNLLRHSSTGRSTWLDWRERCHQYHFQCNRVSVFLLEQGWLPIPCMNWTIILDWLDA